MLTFVSGQPLRNFEIVRVCMGGGGGEVFTLCFFFYKNLFYKNVEAERVD